MGWNHSLLSRALDQLLKAHVSQLGIVITKVHPKISKLGALLEKRKCEDLIENLVKSALATGLMLITPLPIGIVSKFIPVKA